MATGLDDVEETLSQNCAVEIVEELLPVKNKSVFIAGKLKLPDHTVEALEKQYTDPQERLYHVTVEFLKQAEPRPTWRVILDALRSPVVNLPRLAEEIERKHGFRTPATLTSSGLSSSTATAVVPYSAPDSATDSQPLVPAQASGYKFTLAELEAKIDELEEKFDELRTNTCDELQEKKVVVRKVVYELTTLRARDRSEHKVFLEKNLERLRERKDLTVLFEDLNFYWNYLSPGLLEHLAKQFHLNSIKIKLVLYKAALQEFRVQTPLTLFCQIEVKYVEPTKEFCNIVVKFKVSTATTLQDVENFRRKYAGHYNLYDFVLQLSSITEGSFIISFLVPESIIETLRANIPEEILKASGATRLEIAGHCVYSECDTAVVSVVDLHSRPRSMSAPVITHSTLAPVKDREPALIQQLREKEEQLIQAEKIIRRQKVEISQLEEQLRLSEREKQMAQQQHNEAQDTIHKMKEQLLQEHSEQKQMLQSETAKIQLSVQYHLEKTVPYEITRGSATVDHQFVYLTPYSSNLVYSYEWSTEQWKRLLSCPYHNSALVIINSQLTTVGGGIGNGYTNKLVTLQRRQWVEKYPPMEAARSHPALVSTSDGDCIIVIGGWGDSTAVELLKVKTKQWFKITNLPRSLHLPSATICGNQIHVIGSDAIGYSCSLPALPSNDKTITPGLIPGLISWTSLPRLPVTRSTAATLSGQLIIIGGWKDWSQVNSIHQLVEGQWVKICSMNSHREWCLSVSPSPDRVMILGGEGAEDSVEEIAVCSET